MDQEGDPAEKRCRQVRECKARWLESKTRSRLNISETLTLLLTEDTSSN